jgi:nicotinamide-nucleotide amidase
VIRVRLDTRGDGRNLSRAVEELKAELKPYYCYQGDAGLPAVAGEALGQSNLTLGTAESCTAGLLAAAVTDVPGSSSYYRGGVIAYSNEMKRRYLSVRQQTLSRMGAVSVEAAREMALGALDALEADVAVSITGIAGPGGGTPQKPVGTVYIGLAGGGLEPEVHHFSLKTDRDTIRRISVNRALFLLTRFVERRGV